MEKRLTCTECPVGCQITVVTEGEKISSITGNSCPRGKEYATNEIICPRRFVTSTVRAEDGRLIPVKTERAVKKSEVFSVMEKIKEIKAGLPIKIGDILFENISEDIHLIATGNAEKEK